MGDWISVVGRGTSASLDTKWWPKCLGACPRSHYSNISRYVLFLRVCDQKMQKWAWRRENCWMRFCEAWCSVSLVRLGERYWAWAAVTGTSLGDLQGVIVLTSSGQTETKMFATEFLQRSEISCTLITVFLIKSYDFHRSSSSGNVVENFSCRLYHDGSTITDRTIHNYRPDTVILTKPSNNAT